VAAVNSAPIIANVESGPLLYVVGAPAEFITASVTVADTDSPDFSDGVLTVSLSGGDGGDQLSVGTNGGISVAGSSIKVGPTTVASFSYDSQNMILSVYFSSPVDASVVQSVARCVTYAHPSDLQTGTPRTAEFVVTDGDGGTSGPAWRSISVGAV
jgi:hypothetical protein